MLKELVNEIVCGLVEYPDSVKVEETVTDEEIRVTISAADSDMGRVIGKQGRILNAIRTLAKSSCKGQKKKVYIDILENK